MTLEDTSLCLNATVAGNRPRRTMLCRWRNEEGGYTGRDIGLLTLIRMVLS